MRIICCHGHKSAYTAYEAIIQCAKCKGCWHEGCFKIFEGCCKGSATKTVAKDYADFEQRCLGAA